MKLYRKVVMNGFDLEDFPFMREFELEGCLETDTALLSIDDDVLKVRKLIAVEAFMPGARKGNDGRSDMIVAYEGGQIGIVELKRGDIDKKAFDQLTDYLKARKGLLSNEALSEYQGENEELDLNNEKSYIGVLVGTDITDEVVDSLNGGGTIPVYAIVLKRFRNGNEDVFVFSEVYGKGGRDYSKYTINGEAKQYGKGRLVLEVIRRYVAEQGSISYTQLEEKFPKELRGVKRKGMGCFARKGEAESLMGRTGYRRHYLKNDEIIQLKDFEIAVSTEWGLGNIDGFIKHVQDGKMGFDIKKVN